MTAIENERDPVDGSGSATTGKTPAARPRRRTRPGEDDQVGRALRTVFDETVGEAIPPEMLALLGKLA